MRNRLLGLILLFACFGASRAQATCLTSGYGIPCCNETSMSGGGTCSGPAHTYKFTIVSFSFVRDDGSLVTLGSPTLFDAASVTAGSAMGNFISGAALPVGTYVAVEPEIELSQTVSANNVTTQDSLTCNGSVTANMSASGIPACAGSEPNASVRQCTSGSYMKIWDNSLGNIVVTPTSSVSIAFTFKTESGVICSFPGGGGNATSVEVGPLQVTMQLL